MVVIQKVLRFILRLTAAPFGQETIPQCNKYPACAQKCVSDALESSGCLPSDFESLCVSPRFLGQISACALLVCYKEDFDQTYSVLAEDCQARNESIKVELSAFKTSGEEILEDKKDNLIESHSLDLRAVSGNTTTISSSSTSTSTSTSGPPTSSTTSLSDTITTSSSNEPKTLEASSTSTVSTPSPTTSPLQSSASATPASKISAPLPSSSSSLTKSDSTINPTSSKSTTSPLPTTSNTILPTLTLTTPTTATPAATFTPATTNFPLPTIVPCNSDPNWQLTPENWKSLNVDLKLQQTKPQWGSGAGTFLEFVGNFTGVQGLDCGIGTASTCTLLSCPQLQQAGAEPWQYLVAAAVVQMNVLINVLYEGISAGKDDLALVIIAMANDFFEWKNPQTTTSKAAPWLAIMLTAILAFVPLLFPLELAAGVGGAGQAAAAFAAGGLQTLAANSNPETFLLSNMETLGLFVKDISTNATTMLETWSDTLYDGKEDVSGMTIVDYMSGGRFAIPYDIKVFDVANYFFQSVVSDVVNDQLVSNTSSSKTFVMCGDGNVPCAEESHFTENGKSCCLYRFADNNTYIEPPEVKALKSSKYDYINSSSVVASSLRSYLSQGLDYNQSDTNAFINSSLSSSTSNLRNQAFIQGPSAAGIWTLPVCDVGSHTDWVADYSALMMPCCCGPSCEQTVEFFHKAHLAGNSKINDLCKSQYSGFAAVSSGRTLEVPGFGILGISLVLAVGMFL